MKGSVTKIISDMFDQLKAKSRKRRAFVPVGPDVWFFPDIDGCYAVRKVPKRWKGEDAKTVRIYGKNGRFLGEYSEHLIGNDFIHSTHVFNGKTDISRYDLTLENAVRYCYLMTQQISRVANSPSYPVVKTPVIYSECGRLCAVYTGNRPNFYEVFDMRGRMVGRVAFNEYAQYYALYRNMVEQVMSDNSAMGFVRPMNVEEAQSSLNFVFSFINKKIKEHSFGRMLLKPYE